MTTTIKDRTAIVGIGQTSFGKGLDDSELSLACQAISAAIDDAGLGPSEVDGLAMFSMESGREVARGESTVHSRRLTPSPVVCSDVVR